MTPAAADLRHARLLWDYLRLGIPARPAECLLVPGGHDIGVATRAAGLYAAGIAPLIVASGGSRAVPDGSDYPPTCCPGGATLREEVRWLRQIAAAVHSAHVRAVAAELADAPLTHTGAGGTCDGPVCPLSFAGLGHRSPGGQGGRTRCYPPRLHSSPL